MNRRTPQKTVLLSEKRYSVLVCFDGKYDIILKTSRSSVTDASVVKSRQYVVGRTHYFDVLWINNRWTCEEKAGRDYNNTRVRGGAERRAYDDKGPCLGVYNGRLFMGDVFHRTLWRDVRVCFVGSLCRLCGYRVHSILYYTLV